MEPIYFEIEITPDVKYFNCEGMRATLAVTACAGNWRRGHHEGDLARQRCKGCEIGALHAGEAGANRSPFLGTRICARCHRSESRLIHKHLCVSCYNREREVLLGRNAKGNKPSKLKALDARSVVYRGSDGIVQMRTIDRTLNTAEVVVAILRDQRKAVRFGFRGKGPAIDEVELWPQVNERASGTAVEGQTQSA